MNLEGLRRMYAEKVNGAKALSALAKDGILTKEQVDQINALMSEADSVKAQIELAERVEAGDKFLNEPAGTKAAHLGANSVQVTKDEGDQDWRTPGEFFKAVRIATQQPGQEDVRLRKSRQEAKVLGMSEGIPADGGYLIPEAMASTIVERTLTSGEILRRISIDPVTGNNMTYNGVDETSHASNFYGGVIGYWLSEGASLTASKPKWYQIPLQLKKLGALAYATDEQLEDTAALDSWLVRNVPQVLRFQVEDAVYEADGVGKPLGIMNSPCLVSVTRVDASEVDSTDIAKMWSRRWIGGRDYVWFINQDVLPQLTGMTVGNWPVFIPAGGLSGSPYASLYGRPVIEVEYAQSLGTTGDIMLASLPEYQAITKSGGINIANSMHVAFVTDEMAYRFIYRIDGEPLWHSALTPLHGSNTVSPFVVLTSASA